MTTPALRLKLSSLEPTGDGIAVRWLVAVSDGERASLGAGRTEVAADIAGLSDDAIVQAAINSVGGTALLDELYGYHAANLAPIRELQVLDDWVVAFDFYRDKLGLPAVSRDQAVQDLHDGFGSPQVQYNHSIYNLTTGGHWSHTFAYTHDGELFHAKVRNGAVTEWYKSGPDLEVAGEPVAWLAMDLQTGAPIEYYRSRPGDVDSTSLMEKFETATGQLSTSTVHGVMGDLALPADFESDLAAQQFQRRAYVFGYATKSYGRIVEYVAV